MTQLYKKLISNKNRMCKLKVKRWKNILSAVNFPLNTA